MAAFANSTTNTNTGGGGGSMMDTTFNEKWWEPVPGSADEAGNKAFEAFSHAQFKECLK